MKTRKKDKESGSAKQALASLCAALLIFTSIPIASFADEARALGQAGTALEQQADAANLPSEGDPTIDALPSIQGESIEGATASPQEPTGAAAPTSLSDGVDQPISGNGEESTDIGKSGVAAADTCIGASTAEDNGEDASVGETVPLAAPSPRAVSGSVGTLNVQISQDDSSFVDVDSYTDNTVDWEIGKTRTVHVDFEFGAGSDKSIAITVPDDYTIVGYSAVDGSPYLSGLQQLEIHPQYKDYFLTSTVTGTDGTTKWTRQYLDDPYLSWESSDETQIHTYGGIVSYAFADSTTKGQIVITLEPRYKLLSHTASEELMNSIDTVMSSNVGSLNQTFRANVTGLSIMDIHYSHGVWGGASRNVTYDSSSGLSEEFGIVGSVDSYNWSNSYGSQAVYLENWTYTISYPKGVSFANKILCKYLGLGDYATTGGEIIPGHFNLAVTGDKTTGGTVTFTFTNTTFGHRGGEESLGAYFVADIDAVESLDLSFTTTHQMSNRGKSTDGSLSYTRSLIDGSGQYLISITPINEKHRYLENDYPGYEYDYVLGGFDIVSKLAYSDVTLSYDFSDLRGVRGIGVPGYNIRDIVATTTNGRTINLDSVDGKSTAYGSVAIKPAALGLNEGEYLVSLICKADLEQLHYHKYYSYGFNYFGHFADGQEGDVVMSVLDDSGDVAVDNEGARITATDHTTIRYQKAGGHWMGAYMRDLNNKACTTFFPNDTIKIEEDLGPGCMWTDSDTLTDPIVMISLPKGVNLDTSSVEAVSESGNHGDDWFALQQVKTPYVHVVDGVEWTTYYFTSHQPLDMVACEQLPGYGGSSISVRFEAHASSNCPAYGQLTLADCFQWDLGVPSERIIDYKNITDLDTYNRTGKGTDYRIVELEHNFNIEPLIGLNVDLGIRVKDSGTDFFTYDTTENSVAALTKSNNAEVRISYENTAETDYFKDSAIYLPIPKIGNDFAKYFQNTELKNPLNITSNKTFEFNTNLATQVSLNGFTTYYSVDAAENVEAYDPSTNAGTWVPVTGTWHSYDELLTAGKTLADVTMLKLVADDDIATGEKAEGTFELAIDNAARVGQLDYWRAYSKAITDSSAQTGVWNHSSVLAATPASEGLRGQVFVDADRDGLFDAGAGDTAYSGGQVTAILSRVDGAMGNLNLAIQADGSFRSLNESGSPYYLKPGDYVIALTENDDTYLFSGMPGAKASDGTTWYNDLKPGDINGNTAEYRFTIDEANELGCYVGIAMTDFVEVISVDVPVRVTIAVDTDGTWCTPTALDNKIINRSTCAMRVASATAKAIGGFHLTSASILETTNDKNMLAGTISANGGTAQNLTAIDTGGGEWAIPHGLTQQLAPITDGSNELPLQLAGSVKNVEGKYLTAPANAFNITYTFEKAGA